MSQFDLAPEAQHWVNVVLIWIGFGAIVGLLAKSLIPGAQPAGPFGSLLLGMLGSVLGPLTLTLLRPHDSFNPIGPLGLLVAVIGAVLLLAAYRLVLTWLPSDEK